MALTMFSPIACALLLGSVLFASGVLHGGITGTSCSGSSNFASNDSKRRSYYLGSLDRRTSASYITFGCTRGRAIDETHTREERSKGQ